MTATEVKGINEFKEASVRRVHLGAGFIMLLEQVLRLFCISRGLPFLGCISSPHWSSAFDLDAHSTNLQQFPASQNHCLLLPLAAFPASCSFFVCCFAPSASLPLSPHLFISTLAVLSSPATFLCNL